jgi:uncharacterized protein
MSANMELTQRGYALFAQGHIETLIEELVGRSCQWSIPGPKNVPVSGLYEGPAGVADFFTRLAKHFNITKFEPMQFIDGGDTIVVIGREEATVKETRKQYSQEWVHVLRYRDGKMIAFQSYDDTAKIAAAFS